MVWLIAQVLHGLVQGTLRYTYIAVHFQVHVSTRSDLYVTGTW